MTAKQLANKIKRKLSAVRAHKFSIGDAIIAYAREHHLNHTAAIDQLMAAGLDSCTRHRTLMGYIRTARYWPAAKRDVDVSFTHYQELAEREISLGEAWALIGWAEAENVSCAQMRAAVDQSQGRINIPVTKVCMAIPIETNAKEKAWIIHNSKGEPVQVVRTLKTVRKHWPQVLELTPVRVTSAYFQSMLNISS